MTGGHIRQRSPGSWELRWRANSKTCTRTVRGSKRDAERALREAMGKVDRGEHVDPSKIKVGEHVEQRIALWQAGGRIGARTAENYRDLAGMIGDGLGSIPLQKLTMADIERWHVGMCQRGLGMRTVRVARRLLVRALGDAVKQGQLSRNVARDQEAPRQPSAEVIVPNIETVRRILAGLADDPWRVPVVVALYSGLRRGEMLALRWPSTDLDRARLTVVEALEETRAGGIQVKAPKTEAGLRTISLPAVAVDALREHRWQQLERCLLLGLGRPSDDALVFPSMDGATNRSARSQYAGAGWRPGWERPRSAGTRCAMRTLRC